MHLTPRFKNKYHTDRTELGDHGLAPKKQHHCSPGGRMLRESLWCTGGLAPRDAAQAPPTAAGPRSKHGKGAEGKLDLLKKLMISKYFSTISKPNEVK